MPQAPSFSRIVLLGHTGYIGSRLAAALTAAAPFVPLLGLSAPTLDLTRADSGAALADVLDPGCALVICSAIKKQLGDSLDVCERNLAITLNICRALAARPVQRAVFLSSAAVYGEDVSHGVITEATAVQPTSWYGIAKFASERLLIRAAGERAASSLLVLRPAQVYGAGESDYYYGPSGFLRKALSRAPITLWGDGQELREFLFVDDVVTLLTRLTLGNTTGLLNIVSGKSYTYAQALDVVATLAGERPALTSRARTKAKVDHRFDAAALLQACPGFTFTGIEEGLRRVAAGAAAQAEGAHS
jgi:UDP-glucose 4-epimerase